MTGHAISEITAIYTNRDMIKAHTQLPGFPKHRIDLLSAFLNHGALHEDMGNEGHEVLAVAISLMQMGLDTHDLVAIHNEPLVEQSMRSNQLKVLAGDYFSSRFYQLLAKQGRIDVIQHISHAVSELIRTKLDFYIDVSERRMQADQFIKQSVLIKTQLFSPFAKMMKDSFVKHWHEILNTVAHCEVIIEQLEPHNNDTVVGYEWGYWYKQQHQHSNDIKDTLLHMLKEQLTLMQKQIKQCGSEQMILELSLIREAIMTHLDAAHAGQEI